jgi:hypothetical protein
MACFPSNQANVIMVAYGDCNCGVSPSLINKNNYGLHNHVMLICLEYINRDFVLYGCFGKPPNEIRKV